VDQILKIGVTDSAGFQVIDSPVMTMAPGPYVCPFVKNRLDGTFGVEVPA
jgi:hypothetical protein